jgi:hypothetical protein
VPAVFFAITLIRPSFWAKTLSHWADSSAVLGQKVTQECAMWRIASGRPFGARRIFVAKMRRRHGDLS